VPAVGLSDVVDTAHIRMRYLSREPNLAGKSIQIACRSGLSPKEFQCDNLAQSEIVRPIHFPHRSAPKKTDDAIARREDTSRRETCVVDRCEVRQLAMA